MKNKRLPKKDLFQERFKKYLVDYQIEDDKVRIISNIGTSRLVDYNLENMSKINHKIVENKVIIAERIDEYAKTFKDRAIVILFDIILLCFAGVFVPFSFFTGNYIIFLISIIVFSLLVITTSLIAFDYYILAKEIQNLKEVTGYKHSKRFNLNMSKIKSH